VASSICLIDANKDAAEGQAPVVQPGHGILVELVALQAITGIEGLDFLRCRIEPPQALGGAEPDTSGQIDGDAVDDVTDQAVGARVDP
jgi:hypothetical protein